MRKFVSSSVITSLLVAFVFAPALYAEDQPNVVIEEMRYNFGEVFEQKAYVHTFRVRNEGTADLQIKKVKPG